MCLFCLFNIFLPGNPGRPDTPVVTNGLIQHITVVESTGIQWVNICIPSQNRSQSKFLSVDLFLEGLFIQESKQEVKKLSVLKLGYTS